MSDPPAQLRARYLELREVQRALNAALLQTVSGKGLEETARAIGLFDGGRIVLDGEEQVAALSDLALYDYRASGKSAVERRLARAQGSSAVERLLLDAMARARFVLFEIESIEPGLGVRGRDRLRGDAYLLADLGLADTASEGLVLATRLLVFPDFAMTSGAPLVIDPSLAALIVTGLRKSMGGVMLGDLRPHEHAKLARTIVSLALHGLDPSALDDR
jgi:hypothetical protein